MTNKTFGAAKSLNSELGKMKYVITKRLKNPTTSDFTANYVRWYMERIEVKAARLIQICIEESDQ